jgi:hypothetical protein
MDAPKGRYRVIEEAGRLVVIDNETGAPIPSSLAPPRPPGPGRSSGSAPGPVAAAGPGAVDRIADFLLACAADGWDPQGRAMIGWTWGETGKEQRWDARLDEAAQRRMGRALLALFAAPLFLVFLLFSDGLGFALGALATLPPAAWGLTTLIRLYNETDDPALRG